ncbi:hypothetical protein FQN52_006025 [Onygenales sp. PD_12]|nr:hypothetical protein FQN51_004908 [Onygenales sp. PD_10]KAK2789497.1 hypothetical protein FQN52_006025 [Onygenales sp. PD_12]
MATIDPLYRKVELTPDTSSPFTDPSCPSPEEGEWANPIRVPPRSQSWFYLITIWWQEIFACAIAVALLAAAVALLMIYEHRSLSEWPYYVTINAAVSILISIMKAMMIVPLAEGLSQLKWSWFKKPSNLHDMALLDAASRGPFGAGRAMFRFNPFNIMSLGFFVIITAIAIGPFSQQIVAIKLHSIVSSKNSTVPICSAAATYNDTVLGGGPGLDRVPVSTIAAIYNGIYQNRINDTVLPRCSSGNCTFPKYQSLGVCSRCADLTDKIIANDDCDSIKSAKNCSYTLPTSDTEFHLNPAQRGVFNATSALQPLTLDTKGLPIIQNFTAIAGPPDDANKEIKQRTASECMLYFCIITYEGNVHDGEFHERIVSTSASSNISSNPSSGEDILITPEECIAHPVIESLPPSHNNNTTTSQNNCKYTLNAATMRAVRNTLHPLLTGNGTAIKSYRTVWSSNIMEALYGRAGTHTDITNAFASLASALTTHMRSSICTSSTLGSISIVDSYIDIQWRWIILPGSLVAMTVVFLVVTMAKTRGQYIWKSSPLALLFFKPGNNIQLAEVVQENPTLKTMRNVARDMDVKLDVTDGLKIVRQERAGERGVA